MKTRFVIESTIRNYSLRSLDSEYAECSIDILRRVTYAINCFYKLLSFFKLSNLGTRNQLMPIILTRSLYLYFEHPTIVGDVSEEDLEFVNRHCSIVPH